MTGGSNGIGREICVELARCGCNIACLDLDLDAAKELCIEIRQLGVKANAYKVTVLTICNTEIILKFCQIFNDDGVFNIAFRLM